jgi:hypothetical protein
MIFYGMSHVKLAVALVLVIVEMAVMGTSGHAGLCAHSSSSPVFILLTGNAAGSCQVLPSSSACYGIIGNNLTFVPSGSSLDALEAQVPFHAIDAFVAANFCPARCDDDVDKIRRRYSTWCGRQSRHRRVVLPSRIYSAACYTAHAILPTLHQFCRIQIQRALSHTPHFRFCARALTSFENCFI